MAGYSMPAILLPTVDFNKIYPDKVLTCFEEIEADYGLKGFAITIKLWQKVCGSADGYYLNWDDRVCALFAYKIHAGKALVQEILRTLLKEDFFNLDLYEKYGILTADWIQDKWLDYMSRRKNAKIQSEYLLVNCAQNPKVVNNLSKIADKNNKIADKKDSTILNSTILNLSNPKSKKPVGSAPAPSKPICHKYGEYNHVRLTDEQYSKLVEDLGEIKVKDYIKKVDEYCEQSGKSYKNYSLTIRNWINSDGEKSGNVPKPKNKHENTNTSYDLEEWEKYAMSYNPNAKGGTK